MSADPVTDFSGVSEGELSRRWREESERYVTEVNDYVARGQREGWENVPETDAPKDTRQPMAQAVLNAIRRANQSNTLDGLRERFPPAYEPFINILQENGQSLPVVLMLDDGRIVVQIGAPYEAGRVVVLNGNRLEELDNDIIMVGRSPNRKYFAIARKSGVVLHQGWEGTVSHTCQWPTGLEGIPNYYDAKAIKGAPIITRLIPFDSGERVLLVSPEGIFIMSAQGSIRLLPTKAHMREHYKYLQKESPHDVFHNRVYMEHGAISPDGKLIACGHQCSLHYVFDANSLKIVGEIGPLSEYPHHAAFSADGNVIAFNSCHFYNGMTIGVPTFLLPNLQTDGYPLDDRLIQLEVGSRVYAAVSRDDEIIIGDAHGYLRAFDMTGKFRWQYFIGSTVGDIDLSRDGKRLVVTTYGGVLSVIDMDTSKADPFTIGTSTHRERRRWLFWKKESLPLVW